MPFSFFNILERLSIASGQNSKPLAQPMTSHDPPLWMHHSLPPSPSTLAATWHNLQFPNASCCLLPASAQSSMREVIPIPKPYSQSQLTALYPSRCGLDIAFFRGYTLTHPKLISLLCASEVFWVYLHCDSADYIVIITFLPFLLCCQSLEGNNLYFYLCVYLSQCLAHEQPKKLKVYWIHIWAHLLFLDKLSWIQKECLIFNSCILSGCLINIFFFSFFSTE